MSKPKVLFYDIETKPNLAYVWGKWQQDVIAFKEEWQLLSVAWKWEGDSKIYSETVQGKKSDLELCQKLHKLLSEADIVVAHNGDEFDQKKVRARMAIHNMSPLPPLTTIDTKKVAKRYFNFNSNSLNDLGKTLGLGKKVQTGGFDLWLGCMAGESKAWKTMAKYNKQDVALLERVYKRLKPWMDKHPSVALIAGTKGCPNCGSSSVTKDGIRASHAMVKQQWECKECGAYFLTGLKKMVA